jgi:hypothetical protein
MKRCRVCGRKLPKFKHFFCDNPECQKEGENRRNRRAYKKRQAVKKRLDYAIERGAIDPIDAKVLLRNIKKAIEWLKLNDSEVDPY